MLSLHHLITLITVSFCNGLARTVTISNIDERRDITGTPMDVRCLPLRTTHSPPPQQPSLPLLTSFRLHCDVPLCVAALSGLAVSNSVLVHCC
jgi:hypothetical protein|eukprot:COSAG01_NODE_1187_length_11337_cov_185.267574_17_plen_93_part_00